jgi:hypothetical protein
MNDVSLKEYAALVISEPYVLEMDGKVTTSPMGHQGWMAILPSKRHDGRWAVPGWPTNSSIRIEL